MRAISALTVLLASAAGAAAPGAVSVVAATAPPSLVQHPRAIWRVPAHAVQRSVHFFHAAAAKWASARRLQADCTRSCQWKAEENKCDVSDVEAIQMMMGGGSGGGGGGSDAANPMAQVMQAARTCNVLVDSTSCRNNVDCEWKAEENLCDLSGVAYMQIMMGGGGGGGGGGSDAAGPMAQLMQTAMTCSTFDSAASCGNSVNCEWKADENKCDISGLAAMQMMMGGGGGGGGGPMAQLMQTAMTCSTFDSAASCGNSVNCEWKADENKCDISGLAAMQMMMGGGGGGGSDAAGPMAQLMQAAMTCSSRAQATCGDCEVMAGVGRSASLALAVLGGAAAATLA